MMTLEDAQIIGNAWISEWNENQLSNYCSLYDENAEEVSSIANRLIRYSNGRLQGKDTLYSYWEFLKTIFPDNRYILQSIQLYEEDVVIHFTMSRLKANAIAKLSLNEQNKIEKIIICHV